LGKTPCPLGQLSNKYFIRSSCLTRYLVGNKMLLFVKMGKPKFQTDTADKDGIELNRKFGDHPTEAIRMALVLPVK
jgi:hypothetical protein